MPPEPEPKSPRLTTHLSRAAWLVLGLAFLALGFIGALLPIMPTTIFLILAAGCFARSSTRLENWLLHHPRFGPTLTAWRRERAIPRRGKIAASLGMTVGYGLFLLGARPHWPLALTVAAAMAACAYYVLSRPAPAAEVAARKP